MHCERYSQRQKSLFPGPKHVSQLSEDKTSNFVDWNSHQETIPGPSRTALHELKAQKEECDESVSLGSLYCLHTVVLYGEVIVAIRGFLSAQQCFIILLYA